MRRRVSVHVDRLTDCPLSLLSRRQTEDVPLISSIWFIMRLNVYRELLHERARVPEDRSRDTC